MNVARIWHHVVCDQPKAGFQRPHFRAFYLISVKMNAAFYVLSLWRCDSTNLTSAIIFQRMDWDESDILGMAVRLLPWKLLASVCSANKSQTLECRSSSFFGTLSAATPPTERKLPPPTLSTLLGNCLTFIARTGTCLCSTERLEHNGNYSYRLLSLLKTAECCARFSVQTNPMQ